MQLMRENAQQIIQIHINNYRSNQQRLCKQMISCYHNKFFQAFIQIAEYFQNSQVNQEIQKSFEDQEILINKFLRKSIHHKSVAIAEIINRQIIFMLHQNQFKKQQKPLQDVWNVFVKIFKTQNLNTYEFIKYFQQSLELLIQNCSDNYFSLIIENSQQITSQIQDVDLIFSKTILRKERNIQIVTNQGLKMLERFSNRFFISLQALINQLPHIQSEQEAVCIVSQKVHKWSLYLKLIMQFLNTVQQNEVCLQNILPALNNIQFYRIVKEILKIDETLQIKPPIQNQQSGELLGLGLLVSCKYVDFNQNLNQLKSNTIQIINFLLSKIEENNIHCFQNILEILNFHIYQQVIGDLCIISRQFLHFYSTSYLSRGQYLLILKFYEFLNLSLDINVLTDRLFAAINQTIGWEIFLLFSIINLKQFEYESHQHNEKLMLQNSSNHFSNHTQKIKNQRNTLTDFLKQIVQHNQKSRTNIIQLSTSIVDHLFQQNANQLSKNISIKLGMESEPMLQQFLSDYKNFTFWIHILNLMTTKINQTINFQVFLLLDKLSCQLINFQAEILKQILCLCLKVSFQLMKNQKGIKIIKKILNVTLQLGQYSNLEDKRLQIIFLFYTKFLANNERFYQIGKFDKLFDFIFTKIERHFMIIQENKCQKKIWEQHKDLKIYLNFLSKFVKNIFIREYSEENLMDFFYRNQNVFAIFLNLLSSNTIKMSHNQSQLGSEFVKNLSVIFLSSYNNSSKDGDKQWMFYAYKQLLDSITSFFILVKNIHSDLFQSVNILIYMFKNKIQLKLLEHAVNLAITHLNDQELSAKISSKQLKSIIQTLIILSIDKNAFDNKSLLQDACILTIKQCKKKFISHQSIEQEQKISQTPRKLIVKNRLRLQIQAFKLTIFMLANHCKKEHQQKLNQISLFSDKEIFLTFLHQSISLSNQLSSFQSFLTYEDLSIICYAVKSYLKFMNFEEKRGFLVRMAMEMSGKKIQQLKRKDFKNISFLPSDFNPRLMIRQQLSDLMSQIEQFLRKGDNINNQAREQNQKYHYAIRVLLKETQNLAIVENEERKILKVKKQTQNIEGYEHNQEFNI